jgi:hypothetical protein
MAATFIILGLLVGCFTFIAGLLCCNVIFNGWKFHLYVKENYPSKFDTYRSKLNPFKPTKIVGYLDSGDSTIINIANILEKRTRTFLYFFVICFLSIAILSADGFLLHVFNMI